MITKVIPIVRTRTLKSIRHNTLIKPHIVNNLFSNKHPIHHKDEKEEEVSETLASFFTMSDLDSIRREPLNAGGKQRIDHIITKQE